MSWELSFRHSASLFRHCSVLLPDCVMSKQDAAAAEAPRTDPNQRQKVIGGRASLRWTCRADLNLRGQEKPAVVVAARPRCSPTVAGVGRGTIGLTSASWMAQRS
jgi:hypothetical protein